MRIRAFREMKLLLKTKRIQNESFMLQELEEYVLSRAGTLYLAPGRYVVDYIDDMKFAGKIKEVAPFEYIFV